MKKENKKQYKGNELHFWKKDIKSCFIPKCNDCGDIATKQTERGKNAQKNNERPVNWGYYCEECAKEREEIEEEAMYN